MLIVTYDANCGEAIRDGEVEGRVQRDIENSFENNLNIVVASELYINHLRLAVREKRILRENIQLFFNNEPIEMNDKGRIKHWPQGFCDGFGISLQRLLS